MGECLCIQQRQCPDQRVIDNAVKRLRSYVAVKGGHFEQSL